MTRTTLALTRAAIRLADRLDELERRLEAGDEAAMAEYRETAQALAVITPALAPERGGSLLTTAQMAERLAISPKTLLKRKARGEIQPALTRGKFIRWSSREALR
jgi:hypothetical protein